MTVVDMIDDWAPSTQTGSYTYDNGETITYSYSVDKGGVGTDDVHMNPSVDENSATVLFDQETHGIVARIQFFDHSSELAQIAIDGQVVDLNVWLAEGRISVTGPDAPDLFNASGQISGAVIASPNINYIYFNVPINSISMTRTDPGGYGTLFDVWVESGTAQPPCFAAGTLIDTDQGPVAVETLQTGDMIKTKDHGFQPVKWVGGSRVMDRAVRIAKGTFGNTRDLVVSPRHRMLLKGWQVDLMFNQEEVFATAGAMKNGTTITQEPEGWVEYFHILLDRHEVIYAEGAETESFFPDEASLNSIAKKTREELAKAVDLSTFGRTARPTLTANQAMYLSDNMDLLEDEQGQIAAQ